MTCWRAANGNSKCPNSAQPEGFPRWPLRFDDIEEHIVELVVDGNSPIAAGAPNSISSPGRLDHVPGRTAAASLAPERGVRRFWRAIFRPVPGLAGNKRVSHGLRRGLFSKFSNALRAEDAAERTCTLGYWQIFEESESSPLSCRTPGRLTPLDTNAIAERYYLPLIGTPKLEGPGMLSCHGRVGCRAEHPYRWLQDVTAL